VLAHRDAFAAAYLQPVTNAVAHSTRQRAFARSRPFRAHLRTGRGCRQRALIPIRLAPQIFGKVRRCKIGRRVVRTPLGPSMLEPTRRLRSPRTTPPAHTDRSGVAKARRSATRRLRQRQTLSVAGRAGRGVTGLHLGAAYETRARVAILTGDRAAFDEYAALTARFFRYAAGSPVGARYVTLLAQARDAESLRSRAALRAVIDTPVQAFPQRCLRLRCRVRSRARSVRRGLCA
jgi:hypothetical protein